MLANHRTGDKVITSSRDRVSYHASLLLFYYNPPPLAILHFNQALTALYLHILFSLINTIVFGDCFILATESSGGGRVWFGL